MSRQRRLAPDDCGDDTMPAAPEQVLAETAVPATLPASEDLAGDRTAVATGDATVRASSGAAERPPRSQVRHARDLATLPTVDPELYELGDELARGGMGRILRARDRKLGRNVAIKELLAVSDELEARFEREMKITARLQHPAIISVHDAGRWPSGAAFNTMKHVEGRSLDTVIAEARTLAQRLALLPNVLAVADALAYAHSRRVIHRDLKPANVLVGSFGETVVIDWGLAKQLDDTTTGAEPETGGVAGESLELTVLGEAMGTPSYMPPEQAAGAEVSERADVYALGAMLYHVLSGSRPYQDTNPRSVDELLKSVTTTHPTPLRLLEEGVPPGECLAIVDMAMARDAADRYPSARELADDLRRYQTGQLVGAHRYSRWQRVRRWARRHRAAVAVGGAMAVLLVVVGVFSVVRIANERDRAEEQRRVAEEQRRVAEQNRSEAEDLVGFMLQDLDAKLKPIGKTELLDMVADKAAAYYRHRPIDWSRPEDVCKRALARAKQADVLRARGDLSGALVGYRAGEAMLDRLANSDPSQLEWQQDLGTSHEAIGDVLLQQGHATDALVEYRAKQCDLAAFGELGLGTRELATRPGNRRSQDRRRAAGRKAISRTRWSPIAPDWRSRSDSPRTTRWTRGGSDRSWRATNGSGSCSSSKQI